MPPPARTVGRANAAYEAVKQQILQGQYGPGATLPTEKIAAELGVSRQPVMDALKRLGQEGFVEVVPQVGCLIARPSDREITDFFQMFALGEGLVAELATTRATPEDIFNLRLISAQIGELAKMGGQTEELGRLYQLLNRRLHAEIRRMIRSPALAELVESLGDRSDFYIATASGPVFGASLIQAHHEHEELINAIAAKDPAEARRAMKRHILATEARLFEASAPSS